MNYWTEAELAFRCERLSVRLERLAQNFLRMAALSNTAYRKKAKQHHPDLQGNRSKKMAELNLAWEEARAVAARR